MHSPQRKGSKPQAGISDTGPRGQRLLKVPASTDSREAAWVQAAPHTREPGPWEELSQHI